MTSSIIEEKELRIEYFTEGSGKETVVCFHGHGREVKDFLFLKNPKRKLILIVLPYHGKSFFPEERIEKSPLQPEEFKSIFQKILIKEHVKSFHMVGFSQGGRFALVLLPHYQNSLKSVHLISPDGLDYQSFYNKASRNKIARKLFKTWENHPESFIRIAKAGKLLGLVRPKVFAFITLFASSKGVFKRASLTWRGFRDLKPNIRELSQTLKADTFRFKIIMGKYDQVIRTRQAEAFLYKVEKPEALIEIDCGHDFFKEQNHQRLSKVITI